MELYTLDSLLRREKVVDKFESLIWTERYNAFGDFELSIHSTRDNRILLKEGTLLACNESYRVMEVKTVEDSKDAEGNAVLNIKGPSLEKIMDDRVARSVMGDTASVPTWHLTGTAGNIMRQIFTDICVTGILDTSDIIPFMTPGTIMPADTIVESAELLSLDLEIMSVYDAIKQLGDLYDLGFRLLRNFDTSELYFDVYAGSDRTTQQTVLPAVIFSPDLDNLQNTKELSTTETYKNVAYVFSPVGYEVVVPLDIDPSVSGFNRRVLFVDATDITDFDPVVASERMVQRGKEALSKARKFSAFDGELNQNNVYKYNVDYRLGDLVEMRNVDGFTNVMRATEQIFVSDASGERSYPTLTMHQFIMPGEWLSWDYNQHWADMTFEEWASLP